MGRWNQTRPEIGAPNSTGVTMLANGTFAAYLNGGGPGRLRSVRCAGKYIAKDDYEKI
jgi:hypothetical protein